MKLNKRYRYLRLLTTTIMLLGDENLLKTFKRLIRLEHLIDKNEK